MNRADLLTTYHQRIERGERIKLTTQEREFLVAQFIQDLQGMTLPDQIRERCKAEIALLEAGYGAETNSTTNYLSKYRKALEEAVAAGQLKVTDATSHHFSGHKQVTGEPIEATNHLAWSWMRYDNEVYARNRKATNVANNLRQDEPQPFVPDRFLEKATELLEATEAETLAVGIAAVTGRRHTEVVVSGQFSLTKHPYLLKFEGQLKKEHPIAYPIVTLLPAQQVLEAINRFRALPAVQQLEGRKSDDPWVKAFRARVNTRVKQHFQRTSILPFLPGFNSVSIHRLRAAYARMAVYFWLPNQGTNEHRFLQFYLGHVTAKEMKDAPNALATTHYLGYRLETSEGKAITARGIKVMSHAPLPSPTQEEVEQQQKVDEQLDAITQDDDTPDTYVKTEDEMITNNNIQAIAQQLENLPEKSSRSKPFRHRTKLVEVSVQTLTKAAERLGLALDTRRGKGYQTMLNQVLEAVAEGQSTSVLSQDVETLKALLKDAVAEAETRSILAKEVAALKQQLQQAQAERDALQAELNQLASIRQDYAQLQAELAQATSRLNQFLQLATGAQVVSTTPPPIAAPVTTGAPSPQADTTEKPLPPLQHRSHTQATTPKRSPDERIEMAIQALMQHNKSCTDPHDRWFISGNVIADMSRTNPATRVKPWLEAHPDIEQAIEHHNQQMGTTQPHHNRRKDKDELRSIFHAFEMAQS